VVVRGDLPKGHPAVGLAAVDLGDEGAAQADPDPGRHTRRLRCDTCSKGHICSVSEPSGVVGARACACADSGPGSGYSSAGASASPSPSPGASATSPSPSPGVPPQLPSLLAPQLPSALAPQLPSAAFSPPASGTSVPSAPFL